MILNCFETIFKQIHNMSLHCKLKIYINIFIIFEENFPIINILDKICCYIILKSNIY